MLAKHKSLATPGQIAADESRKLSGFKSSTYTGYRLTTVLEKEEQRDKANKRRWRHSVLERKFRK